MTETAKGNVTLYEEGQDAGFVTINDAIAKLEQTGFLVVQDRDQTDPQALSPTNGQAWLCPASSVNEWLGHDGEVAIYQDGWVFRDLANGEVFTILDEKLVKVNDAGTYDTVFAF